MPIQNAFIFGCQYISQWYNKSFGTQLRTYRNDFILPQLITAVFEHSRLSQAHFLEIITCFSQVLARTHVRK